MSRRIDGAPSDDQQPTDLIPQIISDTAAMPVVDTAGYYRPEPGERVPASHRRQRSRLSGVRVGVVAGAVGVLLAAVAGIVLTARDGGTSRESVSPLVSATPSRPHTVVSATPPPPHRAVPPVRRRDPAPVSPVPERTSPRPTVTPRASVSASPRPPKPSPTASPAPTFSVPSQTPGASGATHHSKETPPCPA